MRFLARISTDMKRNIILAAVTALTVVSCSSDEAPLMTPTTPTVHPAARPARVIALPGQAPVAVASHDVDAAFDQQVAAYAEQGTATPAPAVPAMADVTVNDPAPVDATPAPVATPVAPLAPMPPAAPVQDVTAAPAPAVTAAPVQDVTAPAPAASGAMNYKVQITNLTSGRIFVEAQDGAGTIYPCGFMDGKDAQTRSYTTPMESAAPIKGPITVVVRDPDREGSPEIRRYKVTPPSTDYSNKTVNVSILPGGMYLASVDGNVYYQSLPEEPKPEPAKPEAPAPAPEQ